MSTEYQQENREAEDSFLPPLYRVFLLNDDFTTMEFVIEILMDVFDKTSSEAEQVMLAVHQEGRGVAGIYTYDIAATKVREVKERASAADFPLQCVIEE